LSTIPHLVLIRLGLPLSPGDIVLVHEGILLLGQLEERCKSLVPLGTDLGVLLGLWRLAILDLLGRQVLDHHHNAGGSLGPSRVAQAVTAGNEDVGNGVVLAKDGQVRDDVLGVGVAGDDDHGWVVLGAHAERGIPANGLVDFLDSAAEAVDLGACANGG